MPLLRVSVETYAGLKAYTEKYMQTRGQEANREDINAEAENFIIEGLRQDAIVEEMAKAANVPTEIMGWVIIQYTENDEAGFFVKDEEGDTRVFDSSGEAVEYAVKNGIAKFSVSEMEF